MLTSRSIAGSIRVRYALLFLGWVLFVAAFNAAAMALGYLFIVVDTTGSGILFLVLALALSAGGAVSIGFSAGVWPRNDEARRVRGLPAVAGGFSTVAFAMLLVTLPEVYLASTDVGQDSVLMGRITMGMAAVGLPLAMFGAWCVALVGRTNRLLRYLIILACLFVLLLSVLFLACAFFLFFGYVATLEGEENYLVMFVSLGTVWGIAAVFGIVAVLRRPADRNVANTE